MRLTQKSHHRWVLLLQVLHDLAICFSVFDFTAGAFSDIPIDIDDEDLIRQVYLALMHIIQHSLRPLSPDLIITAMPIQAYRDDNITFKRKPLLRLEIMLLEPGAAAESDDFVWADHSGLIRGVGCKYKYRVGIKG